MNKIVQTAVAVLDLDNKADQTLSEWYLYNDFFSIPLAEDEAEVACIYLGRLLFYLHHLSSGFLEFLLPVWWAKTLKKALLPKNPDV